MCGFTQNRLFFLSFCFFASISFSEFYTGTKETLQTEFIFSPRQISHVRNKNVATSLKSDDVNSVGKEMPNKISSNLNIIIIFFMFFFCRFFSSIISYWLRTEVGIVLLSVG